MFFQTLATGSNQSALSFVSFGESNSGGQVPNASATAWELAARSELQILDVVNFDWENLDIGTNNNLDHYGLTPVLHAWELGLANLCRTGFFGPKQSKLVQTGHGGSTLAQWSFGGTYWTKFLARTAYAKTVNVVVWITFGINDTLAGTSAASFFSGMQELIGRIKTQLPGCKIYISKLMTNSAEKIAYNTEIDNLVTADSSTLRAIDTSGLSLIDAHHWDYASQKLIARRASLLMSSDFSGTGKITWSAFSGENGTFAATVGGDRAKSQAITVSGAKAVVAQGWTTTGLVVTIRTTDTLIIWSTPGSMGWYAFNASLYLADNTLIATITSETIVRGLFSGANILVQTSEDGGGTWTTRHTYTNALQGISTVWLNCEAAVAAGSIFASLDKSS